MFRVRKLPEALPRKRGTSVPQLPSNKYYVSLHFGFLHELYFFVMIPIKYMWFNQCSIERRSETNRDKHDAQMAQITVSKPIAIRYPAHSVCTL